MPRTVVGLIVGALAALVSLACSDAPGPLATHRGDVAQIRSTSIPYATGVHTAAIPALDGILETGAQIGDPVSRLEAGGPRAINDLGEIVGTRFLQFNVSGEVQDSIVGVVWTSHFGLRFLPLTGQNAEVVGVNNRAQVALTNVGLQSDTEPIANVAELWDWFGHVRPLRLVSNYFLIHPPQFPSCRAFGINNAGVVAGVCDVVMGGPSNANVSGPFAVLWTPFGTPWPIGGSLVAANVHAISDAGYVAGSQSGFGTNALIFNPNGQERLLPNPPGSQTAKAEALAVNDSGWAVGYRLATNTTCGSETAQPVVWLAADTAIDVGVCGSWNPITGAVQTAATGITDDGMVIGTSVDTTATRNDKRFAFVWTAAAGLRRLPGLEGGAALAQESSGAVAVNHRHQVLGWVRNEAKGTGHTVVWTLP